MPTLRRTAAVAIAQIALTGTATHAQSGVRPGTAVEAALPTVTVNASADASAQGLSPAYPGGQVARGGRAGILGTRDNQEVPFSITSYTNEFIQDRQARSVGDVLLNDPSVRVARGFGNFQESYFIRGFVLSSDDVAYNGLFGLLPRQYIAAELFERVELLRGASAFLTGANPGGGGIGGAINLLPKRAPNSPLTRFTIGTGSGPNGYVAADLARRFGPDGAAGIRLNAVRRDGGTAVDAERAELSLASVGLDWRSRDVRVSADIGWQDNRLRRTRPNVTLGPTVAFVPTPPAPDRNFARSWTYSNERDVFGTLRGEWDIARDITAWAAYGMRRSEESNSLANLTLADALSGAASTTRFDNARRDRVDTGEVGLRGRLRTGPVKHDWVVSAARFDLETDNAFAWDFLAPQATNLYAPVDAPRLPFGSTAFIGNALGSPALTARTRLSSVAIGDTLSFADDRVLLTLGVRHQSFKLQNYAFGSGELTSDYDRSRVSPAAGFVVRVDPRLSLYANYVEGLTRGDTAPGTAVNRGEVLAPHVSKQREVGVKVDAGRVGGGLALFSTTRPRSILTADNLFTSDGRDRHRGIEVTFFGQPARGVRLLGGATWLDAEQQATGAAGLDGNRVIGVPRLQANLGVEWTVPGIERLALDGRVIHTGRRFANDANTLQAGGFTRLDLGARYFVDVGGRLVTLRARVDNVTDKAHWASVGGFPGQGYLVVGLPRTFTVSASMDF